MVARQREEEGHLAVRLDLQAFHEVFAVDDASAHQMLAVQVVAAREGGERPPSLAAAVSKVHTVFHVAADYRLWAPDPRALHRANVDGTRAILDAAAQAGARRVVYTSTVGALGIPKDGTPGTEGTPVTLADMVGPYKASKFLAEQVALGLRAARAAGRHREPVGAGRSLGRQADADGPDDRGLPARQDVRLARHRAQPRARAGRGTGDTCRPPSTGGSARSTSWAT